MGLMGFDPAEIMDILRVKKAHLPPASSTRRRKVTSAASVDDQDALLDPELIGYPRHGEAGPSAYPTPVPQAGGSEGGQDKDADGSTEESDV